MRANFAWRTILRPAVSSTAVLFAVALAAQSSHEHRPFLEDVPPPQANAVTISLDEGKIADLIIGNLADYLTSHIDEDMDGKRLANIFLLRKTIPSFGVLLQDQAPDIKKSYVFHLSLWNSTSSPDLANFTVTSKEIRLVSSRWYAYRYRGGAFHMVSAADRQINIPSGGDNVLLLSLAVMRKMGSGVDAPQVAYKATVKEKTSANTLALETLLAGVLGAAIPTTKTQADTSTSAVQAPQFRSLAYRGQTLLVSGRSLQPPFDVTFIAAVNPPKNISTKPHAIGDGGRSGVQSPPAPDSQHASSVEKPKDDGGNGSTTHAGNKDAGTPTSMEGCNDLTSTGKCSFSQTISVENVQWWDVGIVAPFHGPRLNKYALSQTDTVSLSHTGLSGFIGTFDVSPWARYAPMNKLFYFQTGLPVTGSSFHLPYVGLAQPLPTSKWLSLSLFGGVSWMKQSFPKTLRVGQTTTSAAFSGDLKTDWARKPMYGIELPITAVAKKVKSSLGGKSSSSSTGSSQ